MKLGASTGGRPPYELEEEDLELVQKLAETGMGASEIANAFGVHRDTIYELKKRDKKFSDSIKRGKLLDFINCDGRVKKGDLAPSVYIWMCKTKWKNFYPQEDQVVINKEQTLVDIKALEDIMNKKDK